MRLVRENIARGTTILFEDTSQQIRRLATATRKDAQLELNKNKNSLFLKRVYTTFMVCFKKIFCNTNNHSTAYSKQS